MTTRCHAFLFRTSSPKTLSNSTILLPTRLQITQDHANHCHDPMTKNNLAAHLRWLLNQGPSLYPSLTPSQPANQTVDIANRSASDRTNLPEGRHDIGAVGQQENTESGLGHSGRDEPELKDNSDADMARLALAPNSASKPRMLSLANNSSSRTPKTPGRQGLDVSPSRGGGTGQDVVKGISQSRKLLPIGKLTLLKPQRISTRHTFVLPQQKPPKTGPQAIA